MNEPPSDEDLVREISGGSIEVFDRLMARYQRLVYRISYSYTGDEEDSMDVTQDVFLKAYRGLASFRGAGSFKGWLLSITHNLNINWLRDHGRRREQLEREWEVAPPAYADPEHELLRQERRDRLLLALDRLNPRQRQAVRLRYFGELRISEIAAALDCSEGVAKNILFRGLQKLKAELATQGR